SALAEKMNSHDRPRPLRDLVFDLKWIEIVRFRVDVHEHGPRAHPADRAGRGKKSEGGQYDLVARTKAYRVKRKQECVRSRGTADGVGRAAILSELAFQGRYFGAEDRLPGGQHAQHGLFDHRTDALVLRLY